MACMGCVSPFLFGDGQISHFSALLSYGPTAVNEMLNAACSLRALALVHKSSGELRVYREAMKMFQASIRCLSFSCGRILVKKHSKRKFLLAPLSHLPVSAALPRECRTRICYSPLSSATGTPACPSPGLPRKEGASMSP